MKPLRIILFIVGGLAVLLALVVALALVPGVQTWAVRKAVAGQPGISIQVNRVAAGFSHATISGLRVVKDGAVITADEISATYSAWDYMSHKRVNVEAAAVHGLVADLRNATPPDASKPAAKPSDAPFNGILPQAKLPMDVRVVKFSAEGRALLPAERTATFSVEGRDIETGKEGTVTWKADYADAGKSVPVSSAQTTGTATLHIAQDLRIDFIRVEGNAAAKGANLPADSARIEVTAKQAAAGGDETYDLRVGLMRQQTLEPLIIGHAEFQAATKTLAGTWNVAVGTGQLTSVLAGFGLPDIAAKGAGKFTFTPATNALATNGSLNADVTALEKLSPTLAAVGAVHVQSGFDLRTSGDVAALEHLELTVTDSAQRKLADVTALQKISFNTKTKVITLADPKAQLARITVQALPLAWAQPMAKPMVIEGGDLSLAVGIEANADGSRIVVTSVQPVTLRSVTLRNGTVKLIDQASLSVQPHIEYTAALITADLAALKISLPAGDTIEGSLSSKITGSGASQLITFTTQLQGKLVAALKPYLPIDPGALVFNTSADGQLNGQTLHVNKASTRIDRAAGALLVSFDLQQAIDVNLATQAIVSPKPDAPLARVHLGEVPLAWAEAFVPKSKLGGALAGGVLDVSLRSADDVTIKTVEPILLRGISATLDQQAMVQALDIAADFSASKKGQSVGFDVRQLELKQANSTIAKLVVNGEATLGPSITATAKGMFDADLVAAGKQPALASLAILSKGNLALTFDATTGKTIQAKAAFKLTNLVAKENNQPLGSLEANLDANVTPDGSGSVKLPVVLTSNNRRSDITIDGKVTRSASAVAFDGRLGSTQIFVNDFQALAALAPKSPAATTAPAPTKSTVPTTRAPAPISSTKDTVAFWHGVTGKFDVDLKKIQVGTDYLISGIKGRFAITETRLGIDTLEGKLQENAFKVAGALTFAAAQPKPYVLDGLATVTNFDVGEFLRAAAPNEKPQLESKVTVNAKVGGTGANLPALVDSAKGQFDIAGSQGVLRALANKGKIATGAKLGSAVLGILGAAKGSDNTAALAELTSELSEMNFDHFSMHVERGADLNLKLTALEFISPSKRVTGTGQIEYRAGVPVTDQPLHVEVQLAGKENTARLFNAVGLLTPVQGPNGPVAEIDEKGYAPIRTKFVIAGTPAKPDSSQIWTFIAGEAAKAALGGLLR